MFLHRYIVIYLLSQNIPEKGVVHHKNSTKYDNRVCNLEVTTSAHNRAAVDHNDKSECTSQYKGIRFDRGKWRTTIRSGTGRLDLGSYASEKEAAYKYDTAYVAIHRSPSGSNNTLTEEEIEYIIKNVDIFLPKRQTRDLPKYISRTKNGYRVRFKEAGKVLQKNFKDLENAIAFKDSYLMAKKNKEQQELYNEEILRNDDGIAILPVYVKDSEPVFTLLDDDFYYQFSQIKWRLKDGYASEAFGGNMSLIVCPNKDPLKRVDHINGNRLDNRRCNLRIVSCSFNSRNRKKKEGTSSTYSGVCFQEKRKGSKKWIANIGIDGKRKWLGAYLYEEEAAEAYQKEYLRLQNLESHL